MAHITISKIRADRPIMPKDVKKGTIYITALGSMAYAVTKTSIMLVNDPTANLLLTASTYQTGHFPLKRAPAGARFTIEQEPEEETLV